MTVAFEFIYGVALFSGLAGGIAYFLFLARTTRLHLTGAPLTRLLPLFAARAAIAIALFWTAAQFGAMALLLALAGFLLARVAVQHLVVARP
jgi:hypothetical protein